MPGSTYSTNLKIELMATGENSGTWGTITNTNLGTALEQAIVGYGNPDYASDANLTISITNSNAAQAARALVLNVTSSLSLTATRELVVPTIEKQYIVQNNTTGAQSITVKTSAGTGITVPNGRKAHLYVDGTNVIQMFDFVDINGGTIDGATVGASSASTGAFTTLTASGATTLNGAVALGDASGDLITFPGTVNSNLLFTDATYDIGASGANRPRDLFLSRNLTVGGTLTLAGGVNLNGNVTVGDSSSDTLTINSTITSNLIFTDNTYDIGASGATRPRNLFLAGNATIGGNQTLTGSLTVDSTTDSSSTTTGSIQTDGGLGVAKAAYIGTTLNIGGLTSGRVAYVTTSGRITDSANLIFNGQNLAITNTASATGPLVPSYALEANGNANLTARLYGTGEAYGLNTASSKDQYYQAGTLINISAITASVNSAALIDFNAYNATGGASNIFLGAIAGSSNAAASFVLGRRTGATSWAESLRVGTDGGLVTTPSVNGHTVINENGIDADFRVESDNVTHMLFVDAGNDRVGVGISNPSKVFQTTSAPDTSTPSNGALFGVSDPGLTQAQALSTSTGLGTVAFASNHAGDWHWRSFWGSVIETGAGGVSGGAVNATVAENAFAVRQYNIGTSSFTTNFVMYTNPTGATVFNEDGLDRDFRVESDNNTNMLFVDAGNDVVSIGTSTVPNWYSSDTLQSGTWALSSLLGSDQMGLSTGCYQDAYGELTNWKFKGAYPATLYTQTGAHGFRVTTSTNGAGNAISWMRALDMSTSAAVFNEDSNDIDFRVESDTNTHMLFVDGGGNWVSIGGNTQGYAADLTVDGNGGAISCYDANGGIYFGTGGGGFGTNPAIARASTAGFHISSSAVGDLCIGAETNTLIRFGTSTSGTPTTRMTIAANGDVNVVGALSKGSGSFRIDHPLPSRKDTHQLVHSFVESPQADLIYRGKAQLVSGRAVVNIDRAAGMTEGTFVVLCRDVQCFTSNEQDWDAVRGSVTGNILTIECQNPASTAVVSWMVIGERQDPHMYETDWTDENGKVIVEPLKPIAAIS